jgi:hypothetical protein
LKGFGTVFVPKPFHMGLQAAVPYKSCAILCTLLTSAIACI